MNGRVGNDQGVGKYSFVGNSGCSLVDNVLTSRNMFRFVKSFEVQEPNIFSDHCLIIFTHLSLRVIFKETDVRRI